MNPNDLSHRFAGGPNEAGLRPRGLLFRDKGPREDVEVHDDDENCDQLERVTDFNDVSYNNKNDSSRFVSSDSDSEVQTMKSISRSESSSRSRSRNSTSNYYWTKNVFLLLVFSISLVFHLVTRDVTAAGGDCMGAGTVECFECNSFDDPRCHDPFNYTLHKRDMPPIRLCEGCCVKMVQFIGTEHYQIKRTCTDDFEVNFFMVNHACMTEGHRHGHMCFCEEDECNTATTTTSSFAAVLTLAFTTFILRR